MTAFISLKIQSFAFLSLFILILISNNAAAAPTKSDLLGRQITVTNAIEIPPTIVVPSTLLVDTSAPAPTARSESLGPKITVTIEDVGLDTTPTTSFKMSPLPKPSGIVSLPADLATRAPTGSSSPDNTFEEQSAIEFSPSTIAAIVLGIALFLTICGIIGYCLWTRRQNQKHYRHRIQGCSGEWTVVKENSAAQASNKARNRDSILPTYVKRLSMSKPASGIDINRIGHPTLISSQNHGMSNPTIAYIHAGKGATLPGAAIPASTRGSPDQNIGLAGTEPLVKADRRVTVEIPTAPPPVLRVDTRRRPTLPTLTIPGEEGPKPLRLPEAGREAITTTTIAGLSTSLFVPPTPSKTSFMPATPRRTSMFPPRGPLQTGNGSVCEFFSPDEIQANPSPPPKDTQRRPRFPSHRYSDPTSATPASGRSIRSLSWNGHGQPAASGVPEWMYTAASTRRTPVSREPPYQQNWVPMNLSQESIHTDPRSLSSNIPSTVPSIPSKFLTPQYGSKTSLHERKPRDDDDIISSDEDDDYIDDSYIESDYEISDDEHNSPPPQKSKGLRKKASSLMTRGSQSTRFSQESMETPLRKKPQATPWDSSNRSYDDVNNTTRPLSSPGLQIVPKPGAESPPLSPIVFKIDESALTPKPLVAKSSLANEVIPKEEIYDDSYPEEWRAEMERIAAEEAREKQSKLLSARKPVRPTLRVPGRKSVSFNVPDTKASTSGSGSDSSDAIRKIRPSWYNNPDEAAKLGMF